MFDAIDTSASGLRAYRTWLDAVADNVANLNDSATSTGQVFHEEYVQVSPITAAGEPIGQGVTVSSIEHGGNGQLSYEPDNPIGIVPATDGWVYAAMRILSGVPGGVINVHCENTQIASWLKNEMKATGRQDLGAYTESRPSFCEVETIRRMIFLAERTKCSLHLVHTSVGMGPVLAAEAQSRGIHVTVETCPHYLTRTCYDEDLDMRAKISPPLRDRNELEGLWAGIANGSVYSLGTDHVPFLPKKGDWLANYSKFFSDPFLYDTIWSTFRLAIPATLVNVLVSVPIALRVRRMRHRRVLTTILVVPITLGTVLIAQGLLIYLGPQGWFNRVMAIVGIGQMRLVHNYTGVMLSLIMSGFPFTFLLTLSYLTGIDPSLEQAAATLGAKARARFVHILMPLLAQGLAINLCLSFVQTFSVFPSAVLLGAPASETRVISIAAYQAAYEQYDYSMASAVAMIMGFCQLAVVILILAGRNFVYRGTVAGGKG